jgi:hypothetical protein
MKILPRLVAMDDVVFVGTPAHEEHLQSKYLVFESNFDGGLDVYLKRMAKEAPDLVESVWSHCVGDPGVRDIFSAPELTHLCFPKMTQAGCS